jgi:hypothetical protein
MNTSTSTSKSTVTFGKFSPMRDGDEGDAAIMVDGKQVGFLSRDVKWTDVPCTNRSTGAVQGYKVTVWGDAGANVDETLVHTTLAAARAVARQALAAGKK